MSTNPIRNIEMKTGNWGKTAAYATIILSNGMRIPGFKVINGKNGLFVGLPSYLKKDKETGSEKWENLLFFKEKDEFFAFQKVMVAKYHEEKNGRRTEGEGSYQDHNSSSSSEEKDWWQEDI